MTTAEQLALAVLKGDKDAIRALHDCLAEDFAPNGEAKEIPPIQKITVPFDRLRVVVYFKADSSVYMSEVENDVQRWLIRGVALTRPEIDRVEIYELPENFLPRIEVEYPSRAMEYTGDGLGRNVLTPEQFREMIDSSEPQGYSSS